MRKFQWFEIGLILFLIGAFVIILTTSVKISEAEIPTAINGLVASISMIIGFAGAIMIFTLSKQWDTLKLGSVRPVVYLVIIGVPIVLLWSTFYTFILQGDSTYAIKIALFDLAISSVVLVDFITYYERETILHMRENTIKEIQSKQVRQKSEEKKTE